jgi:hypothetical protein
MTWSYIPPLLVMGCSRIAPPNSTTIDTSTPGYQFHCSQPVASSLEYGQETLLGREQIFNFQGEFHAHGTYYWIQQHPGESEDGRRRFVSSS